MIEEPITVLLFGNPIFMSKKWYQELKKFQSDIVKEITIEEYAKLSKRLYPPQKLPYPALFKKKLS